MEIGLLQLLNTRCDPGDAHHIVRLVDFFLFRRHLCLVFEKLDVNLFELLRRNGFRWGGKGGGGKWMVWGWGWGCSIIHCSFQSRKTHANPEQG